MTTVRDAFFDVLREQGTTTIFANPGSTEIPLLTDLPADIDFVLCLHEGSVVGAATGWAIGRQAPAMAVLHTTAGYGNAVGAIATARVNHAPVVIIVGQQDRRHLAHEPFLTGELDGLAGSYPVWTATPNRAADVPALVARAHHEAVARKGPAVVIVPMDDWDAPFDMSTRRPAPTVLRVVAGVDEELSSVVADQLTAARTPVIISGAGADDARTWAALVELAGALDCPVWQEAMGGRAGFPQDSKRFAGHLPAGRAGVRQALSGHDLVLVVGAGVLRQYAYEPGDLFASGTQVVVITDDVAEATRSVADLAVLTALPAFTARVARLVTEHLPERTDLAPAIDRMSSTYVPGPHLRAEDVYLALGDRLPADSVVVEESPSTRSQLQDMIPARNPLGFLSAAMGGLGFAMPAALGLKLACPDRPVVAVVGDGSSLYAFQSVWTAQRYGAGVVYIVLTNGGYAIMDWLAERAGGLPPWPSFDDIDIEHLASALGCEAVSVRTREELVTVFDDVLPSLASRSAPILVNVIVQR